MTFLLYNQIALLKSHDLGMESCITNLLRRKEIDGR